MSFGDPLSSRIGCARARWANPSQIDEWNLLLAPLFNFAVEWRDALVDAQVYLILGLVEQSLERPKIYWTDS